MDKEVFDKYIKAGRIAAEVRESSKQWAKPGTKLLDLAEKIEKMIKDKGGDMAFPVNLSLNDKAAHYTPAKNDETMIGEDDILKIDIGVHVDGYVGDTACTLCWNEKHKKLIEASEKALDDAMKLCKPGALISDIGKKIEETIKAMGFKPIENLTGHGLERYDIHSDPQLMNVEFNSDYKLKEDEVIAIEPFATTGKGSVKNSEDVLIFSLVQAKPVRNMNARKIIAFAEGRNGLPFAERWIPLESRFGIRVGLRELRMNNVIYDYPVLKEREGGMVSQAEHTIIVRDEPIVTTLAQKMAKKRNPKKYKA